MPNHFCELQGARGGWWWGDPDLGNRAPPCLRAASFLGDTSLPGRRQGSQRVNSTTSRRGHWVEVEVEVERGGRCVTPTDVKGGGMGDAW